MHNLSRCKRIGFKRGAIPPAAQCNNAEDIKITVKW
nr:MAG TPA: hypothetical protein [Caudoviricetes sp.]